MDTDDLMGEDAATHARDQPDAEQLLAAPLPWLALLLAGLDQPAKRALMGTCHRARRLVLSHSRALGCKGSRC
jgi:hypothetical protein